MKPENIQEDSLLCHRGNEPRIHGLIQALLLLNIGEEPRHGYELFKVLSTELPEGLVPDVAVIYSILRKLEKEAYVRSRLTPGERGPARKVYSLTPNGADYLAQWYETIHTRVKALFLFLNKYEQLATHFEIEEVSK